MLKNTTTRLAALFCTIAAANAETAYFTDIFELKLQNNGAPATNGADVTGYFIDGGASVAGDTDHSFQFLRFENLFGTEAGGIPAGATILDASLTMWTAVRSNAQSGGIFGVAPLLAPFAASNLYSDYSGPGYGYDAGASYFNQHTGRPAGGFAGLVQGVSSSADVTLVLQQWAQNPASAHGFAIQPRTNDGWFPETVGSTTVENRPMLQVNYTTAATTTYRFQQDMNGYLGSTSALLDANGTTTDGAYLGNAAFLDGPNSAGDSRDIQGLLKFDSIFGDLGEQIKPDENILRAYLVLTTGNSVESHSGGTYDVHQMLTAWDATSTFDTFGGDGPTLEQNEVSLPLGTVRGMTQNSQALLDVTEAVRAWQGGAENHGLNIQSNTTDGWNVFFSGANDPTTRPELVVVTGVPEPGSAMLLVMAAGGMLGTRRLRHNR